VDDLRYLRDLLDRGVYGAFDLFGFDHSLLSKGRYAPSDHQVAEVLVDLIARGYGDQLLISHDVGVRTRLHRFGGWGYDHILAHVVPLLMDLGVDASMIDRMLIENPRRMLAIPSPEAGGPS
jgi:phosphotriesterase-related protein